MRADELIEILKTLPPETEMVLSEDSEGNNFVLLETVYTSYFLTEDEDGINLYNSNESPREYGMSDDEWEEFKNSSVKCAVLWP